MSTPVINPGVFVPESGALIEAALAFGLIAAVLIGMADTSFYPVAVGIVLSALLYELLVNNKALNVFSDIIGWSSSKLGG